MTDSDPQTDDTRPEGRKAQCFKCYHVFEIEDDAAGPPPCPECGSDRTRERRKG